MARKRVSRKKAEQARKTRVDRKSLRQQAARQRVQHLMDRLADDLVGVASAHVEVVLHGPQHNPLKFAPLVKVAKVAFLDERDLIIRVVPLSSTRELLEGDTLQIHATFAVA